MKNLSFIVMLMMLFSCTQNQENQTEKTTAENSKTTVQKPENKIDEKQDIAVLEDEKKEEPTKIISSPTMSDVAQDTKKTAQNNPISSTKATRIEAQEVPVSEDVDIAVEVQTKNNDLVDAQKKVVDYLAKYAPKSQNFQILNPTKDNWVMGKNGIQILFPANIFDLENPNTPVEIELREYNTYSDFLMANLHSQSDNNLLETNGMINIKAKVGDKELNLKKGENYYLYFPNDSTGIKDITQKEEMQLFDGVHTTNHEMNWNPTPTSNNITLKKSASFDCDSVAIIKVEKDTTLKTSLQNPYFPVTKSLEFAGGKEKTSVDILGETYIKGDSTAEDFYPLDMYLSHKLGEILPDSGYKYLESNLLVLEGIVQRGKAYISGVNIRLNSSIGQKNHGIKNFSMYECKLMEQKLALFHKDTLLTGEMFVLNNYYDEEQRTFKVKFDFKQEKPEEPKFMVQYRRTFLGYRLMDKKEKEQCEAKNIMTSGYVFQAQNLGFINCDRFYNVPDNRKVQFAVNSPLTEQSVRLIFDDIRAVMRSSYNTDGEIVFNKVPEGMSAKVVVLGFDEKGDFVMSVKPILIGNNAVEMTDFEEFSMSELSKKI